MVIVSYKCTTEKKKKLAYLSTTALSFRCTFNNSRKIKQLNFGIIVVYDPRYASKRCKLIGGSFRLSARQHC